MRHFALDGNLPLTSDRHQFDHNKWLLLAPDIPSQQDACSCSVYACINAVAFVQSPQLPIYSSQDITKIRYWMVNLQVNTLNVTKLHNRDVQTEILMLNYVHIDLD